MSRLSARVYRGDDGSPRSGSRAARRCFGILYLSLRLRLHPLRLLSSLSDTNTKTKPKRSKPQAPPGAEEGSTCLDPLSKSFAMAKFAMGSVPGRALPRRTVEESYVPNVP